MFRIEYLLICVRCCVEGPSCFVIYGSAVVRNRDLFQTFQQCTAVFFCDSQPVVAVQADGFSAARITVCQCSCTVYFCNGSVSFESVFAVIKIEICDHGFFCCLKLCTHLHGCGYIGIVSCRGCYTVAPFHKYITCFGNCGYFFCCSVLFYRLNSFSFDGSAHSCFVSNGTLCFFFEDCGIRCIFCYVLIITNGIGHTVTPFFKYIACIRNCRYTVGFAAFVYGLFCIALDGSVFSCCIGNLYGIQFDCGLISFQCRCYFLDQSVLTEGQFVYTGFSVITKSACHLSKRCQESVVCNVVLIFSRNFYNRMMSGSFDVFGVVFLQDRVFVTDRSKQAVGYSIIYLIIFTSGVIL